jgi:GNAT superfamily N-acetyltransferase
MTSFSADPLTSAVVHACTLGPAEGVAKLQTIEAVRGPANRSPVRIYIAEVGAGTLRREWRRKGRGRAIWEHRTRYAKILLNPDLLTGSFCVLGASRSC